MADPTPQTTTAHTDDAARPESEWHEEYGAVLWWHLDEYGAVSEPPIVCYGTELEYQEPWPGYYSHWSPLPAMPQHPVREMMLAPAGTLICDAECEGPCG